MPKKSKPEESFAALVKRNSNRLVEALQAGGHAGLEIDQNTAEPIDWIRAMNEALSDIMLEARFDISDPETNKALRIRIARLAAFCEAWDKQLN